MFFNFYKIGRVHAQVYLILSITQFVSRGITFLVSASVQLLLVIPSEMRRQVMWTVKWGCTSLKFWVYCRLQSSCRAGDIYSGSVTDKLMTTHQCTNLSSGSNFLLKIHLINSCFPYDSLFMVIQYNPVIVYLSHQSFLAFLLEWNDNWCFEWGVQSSERTAVRADKGSPLISQGTDRISLL